MSQNPLNKNVATDPAFLLVDLYAGGGGTTLSAEKSGFGKVIAAVNHDEICIKSHKKNFSNEVLHLREDTRLVNVHELAQYVYKMRQKYPLAKVILWASLECTHFSQAKGGQARDADSRTLALDLERYIRAISPDYVKIENVKEFLSWGDLDENGKPVSKYAGKHYQNWVWSIEKMGYRYDYRLLNAADFGAATTRIRYFGIFAKNGLPISFPEPTHKSKKSGDLFPLPPWRPVSECLDLNDHGTSIFEKRKTPVPATLRRLLKGLKKFAATRKQLVMTCNNPGYCKSVDEPCSTVTTAGHKMLITPVFLNTFYGSGGSVVGLDSPCPTLTTKDRVMLASVKFAPSGFLMSHYSQSPGFRLLQEPAQTVTTINKLCFVSLRFDYQSSFLVNPQFDNNGRSISDPCPTVIATQKSRPLSLCIPVRRGSPKWEIKDGDCPDMIALKNFMREHGIVDIYTRMLKVIELKRIQGFPDDYILLGKQEEQKKMIGNSVEVYVGCSLFTATGMAIRNLQNLSAA